MSAAATSVSAAGPPPVEAATNGDFGARPPPQLSSTAWVPRGELAYDEWLRHGSRLGVAGRSVGWWVGDWLRYGSARYGQKSWSHHSEVSALDPDDQDRLLDHTLAERLSVRDLRREVLTL